MSPADAFTVIAAYSTMLLLGTLIVLWIAAYTATAAAIVIVPGWFSVRMLGWRNGLLVYGLILLTAYRMAYPN